MAGVRDAISIGLRILECDGEIQMTLRVFQVVVGDVGVTVLRQTQKSQGLSLRIYGRCELA